MIKTIVAPIDGSEHANKAADFAADLAKKYAAKLILLHVWQPGPIPEELRHMAEVEKLESQRRAAAASRAASIQCAGGWAGRRSRAGLSPAGDYRREFAERIQRATPLISASIKSKRVSKKANRSKKSCMRSNRRRRIFLSWAVAAWAISKVFSWVVSLTRSRNSRPAPSCSSSNRTDGTR